MTKIDSETDLELEGQGDAGEEEAKQKLDLSVDILAPSACQRHVTVTIPRTDIERYFNKVFTDMMPGASVPGFRQGRAPRKLVESHYRREVENQVKGSLLLDSMAQITDGGEFSAISEPDFNYDAVEIPETGPLVFEFDIEVRPDFTMPQWRGLTLDRPVREFGTSDVDVHLEKMFERFATMEPVDGEATAGDFVVVNMTARHAGAVVSETKEQPIRIRPTVHFEDAALSNFDDLMIGAKAGDRKSAVVETSDDVESEALRNIKIDLDFEVLEVKRLAPVEMTQDLISSVGSFETEGDLRDAVQKELERQLAYHQRQQTRQQITDLLTEAATWELPPDLLRRQSRRELDRAVMELRSSGFTDEQIQAHANLLRQNCLDSTARALKEHFILERIAEEEGIEATEAEYEREIMLMAWQSGESPRSVRSRIEKRGLMDALRNQIIEGRALELIAESATFREVPYVVPETTSTAVDFAVCGTSESNIPSAKYADDAGELKTPVERD